MKKHKRFNDNELRLLLLLTDGKGHASHEIEKELDMDQGKLSRLVNKLEGMGWINREVKTIYSKGSRSHKDEYPFYIQQDKLSDLCSELQYRMNAYERERGELQDIINQEFDDWMSNGNELQESDNFRQYKSAQTKLKDRSLDSTSITNSLKEVSYPVVRYWLWRMKQEVEKLPKLELPRHGQVNTTQD